MGTYVDVVRCADDGVCEENGEVGLLAHMPPGNSCAIVGIGEQNLVSYHRRPGSGTAKDWNDNLGRRVW